MNCLCVFVTKKWRKHCVSFMLSYAMKSFLIMIIIMMILIAGWLYRWDHLSLWYQKKTRIKKSSWPNLSLCHLLWHFGFDHINRNAPVLIRTPKLTRFEPAQYWGGGPPGNSVVLNPFLSVFVPGTTVSDRSLSFVLRQKVEKHCVSLIHAKLS